VAVNRSRNQNAELGEGATDGSFKKIPQDRSNVSDENLALRHGDLSWRYGFEDLEHKVNPGAAGLARRDPKDHG
jgi:hypothetical protein